MRWSDTGIVLSVRKHGENSAVVRVFAQTHGVYGGIVKGASSKTNRGILQPGNVVNVSWNARLSEHLGMFKIEPLESTAALIMNDAMKLAALSSACAILESALPERYPYARLYGQFREWLEKLREFPSPHRGEVGRGALVERPSDSCPHPNPPPTGEGIQWLEDYVRFELMLLAETGFGLDLSRCAATGATDNLVYVSPKSGRAVSRDAGEPYKEKLLKLPEFLLSPWGRADDPHIPPSREAGEQVKALPLEGGGLGGGDLTVKSPQLRKNQTDAEKKLWQHLSQKQLENYRFRRQHPMGGKYIVDFICLNKKLIIELDGGQHAEQQAYDTERTAFLESEGYKVLRFWNNDVMENIEGVYTAIQAALHPHGSTAAYGLASPAPPSRRSKEIADGLALTGYFLGHWLLEPHHRKLPAARKRLVGNL